MGRGKKGRREGGSVGGRKAEEYGRCRRHSEEVSDDNTLSGAGTDLGKMRVQFGS